MGILMKTAVRQTTKGGELSKVLLQFRSVILSLAVFSGLVNILALTGSLFMMQIYDRVLSSRSIPTLISLAVITIILYLIQGVLDFSRSRIMARMANFVDQTFSPQLFRCVMQLPLRSRKQGDELLPIRDLDTIRNFLASPAPLAFFDLPWMPLYLIFIFCLHPYLGILSLSGMIILIMLTILTEILSKKPAQEVQKQSSLRISLSTMGSRNAEVLQAMGMAAPLLERWKQANESYLRSQERSGDVVSGISSVSKVVRFIQQSAMLGLAAYLVIQNEMSSGSIIASSIISSRVLAPIEGIIGNWKNFISARQSRDRVEELLSLIQSQVEPMALPAPKETLSVENVSLCAPGTQKILIHGISFTLNAGQGLGIIGPSASGKTTLAKALVNVWRSAQGAIRLDGATLDQWSPSALGAHIGYLPQDIELFDGTIADNIARFSENPDPEEIIAAAKAADVHQMILHLPDGYETMIGDRGSSLSAGQRQRIALARALYGDPFLVVLDEPNSNLDSEGEQALTSAIMNVRNRKGIVIVIAHRPSALAAVNLVAVMAQGKIQTFGPKDEVLKKVTQPHAVSPSALSSKLGVVHGRSE